MNFTTLGSITLTWTAPDDGVQGTAFRYDLRYSTQPINDDNWPYAKTVEAPAEPQPASSQETVTVTGLDAGTTYYFAIRARDDAWQESALSNTAAATTQIPNLNWSKQRVYWASWDDYQSRHLSIDYRMANTGTGIALQSTVQASFATPNTVYVVTPLPTVMGDISPGAYRNVTLKYYVPINVTSLLQPPTPPAVMMRVESIGFRGRCRLAQLNKLQ